MMKSNFLWGLIFLSTFSLAKVDFDVSGEGVAYYQTNNALENSFFSQESSQASVGLEINVNAKVDNGFELGYAGTFLGTLGLEDSLVSRARQNAQANELNAYATTEAFLFKRVENTSIKLGRQKLSMAYSPLLFSESWNVFENAFDALVVMNQDIKNTNITAAYIHKSNTHNNLSGFANLANGRHEIKSGIYLVTMANKSLENLPITASYYFLDDINGADNGSALWLDIKSTHMPVKFAFQTGYIDPSNALSSTSILGAKAVKEYDDFSLSLAYSVVSSGDFSFQNFRVANDSPLYTQMVNNQDFIALDASTWLLKTITKLGKGSLTVQYGATKDGSANKNDFSELDVVYKFDLLATKMFVGYIGQKTDNNSFAGKDSSHNIRVWSRYAF